MGCTSCDIMILFQWFSRKQSLFTYLVFYLGMVVARHARAACSKIILEGLHMSPNTALCLYIEKGFKPILQLTISDREFI